MTTFTTDGPVRGDCGHRHRSIRTAQQCADRDHRGCARQSRGGYSDRQVRALTPDGSLRQLTDEEWDELNRWLPWHLRQEEDWD